MMGPMAQAQSVPPSVPRLPVGPLPFPWNPHAPLSWGLLRRPQALLWLPVIGIARRPGRNPIAMVSRVYVEKRPGFDVEA